MSTSRVRSIEINGHWRSGRRWGNQWVEVASEDVTQAMREDPRLRVEEEVCAATVVPAEVPAEQSPVVEPTATDEPANPAIIDTPSPIVKRGRPRKGRK